MAAALGSRALGTCSCLLFAVSWGHKYDGPDGFDLEGSLGLGGSVSSYVHSTTIFGQAPYT
ncbi:hypothetical protein VD0002_g669 [Verticillium dahliae]|uniref:Uncharacterized protein n=1 Tax=Verticillium dahliae TaxID=27337 RepID=A0AA44WGY7_VERDA|nr:hypothetical protein BJF96_g6144 [Verticillium dahliae]PNH56395.1 hypothetical protein VD0003_g1340 [Verticillium dahliae]PNH69799.1 hypothetical protein VD0002_g669 [Verticillium dahliae]